MIVIIWFVSQNNIELNDVESITLECIQACLSMENPPFNEKEFKEKVAIEVFLKAINNAEKMKGSLDYSAVFFMTLSLKNGDKIDYHLVITNTDIPQRGLILELPNTEQGYKISEKTTRELKELIYTTIPSIT